MAIFCTLLKPWTTRHSDSTEKFFLLIQHVFEQTDCKYTNFNVF